MPQGEELVQEKSSNSCCAALNKKHTMLLEKYKKVELLKNQFRDCLEMVEKNYDLIEKENESLKKEMDQLKVQANTLKDENAKEAVIRIDLENEVSALKDEIQVLKQKSQSCSQESCKQLQQHLNMALKKAEEEKKRAGHAENLIKFEREKAKENLLVLKKKADEALRKAEIEKKNASEAQLLADVQKKKTEETRILLEKMEREAKSMKSTLDSYQTKFEAEAKAVQPKRLAKRPETNSKMLVLEKDRTGDLDEKNNHCVGILQSDSVVAQLVDKLLQEKENNIIRQKKKATKLKKVVEAHEKEKIALKNRADQLSGQVETYKLRLEQLQNELQELVSFKVYAENMILRYNSIVSKTDRVSLLKAQLNMEKMLIRHAKKLSKVEACRNNVPQNEVFNLRQDCPCLQNHIDFFEKSLFNGEGGKPPAGKVGTDDTCVSGTLCSMGYHNQVFSGTDSRLDPPNRSSNKKKLHSSVINSSSASFSEPNSMGSQERGTLLVSTSAKLGEDISYLESRLPNFSDDKQASKKQFHTSVDDTGEKSLKLNTELVRLGRHKRKRVHTAEDSTKMLCSQGDGLQDTFERCNPKKMSSRLSKRINTSKKDVYNLPVSDGSERLANVDADHLASQLGSSVRKSNTVVHEKCVPDDFDGMGMFDYMNLLDLDMDSDESAYRRAFALPLSPSLPEANFEGDGKLEVANDEIFINKNFPSTSVDDPMSSKLLEVGNNVCCLKNSVKENENCSLITEASHTSTSGNKEHSEIHERRTTVPSLGHLFKYLFVFTENNSHTSILKVLQAVGSFMQPCSLIHSGESFFERILQALSSAEGLSVKDKICVMFSLLLHEIIEAGNENLLNAGYDDSVQALDDLASVQILSALSDPVLRKMFLESIDLFELNDSIENFFLQRKVLALDGVTPELQAQSISKVELLLNGNPLTLYEVVASDHLLVATASLFASVCSALDQVGLVCEMSCNIISMLISEAKVLMEIFHVFARVCGSKYFTLQSHSMAITVVKSLAVVFEKRALSPDSMAPSSEKPSESSWFCCGNCPFAKDAIAIEDVSLMLLANLQKHAYSESSSNYVLRLANLLTIPPPPPPPFDPNEKFEETLSSTVANDDILDFMDVLALIEAIASFMGWDWSYDHIIIQILDAHHQMDVLSAAIILLISQLGRIGVIACGYADPRVKKLQQWLSASVRDARFSESTFFDQVLIVKSLFGLTPVEFEEAIIHGETTTTTTHQIPVRCIQEWFSGLNDDQKYVFSSLLAFTK